MQAEGIKNLIIDSAKMENSSAFKISKAVGVSQYILKKLMRKHGITATDPSARSTAAKNRKTPTIRTKPIAGTSNGVNDTCTQMAICNLIN